MKHIYAVWFLLFFQPFLLKADVPSERINSETALLHDAKGAMDLLDLLSDDADTEFKHIGQKAAFLKNREGFYWLKITPSVGASVTQPYWVYLPSAIIDSAEVFFVQPKHGLEHYEFAQLHNFSSIAGLEKQLAFPFYPIGKENLVIYVKFRIKQTGFISASIARENYFYKSQKSQSMLVGLLSMLVLLSVFLILTYPRKAYQAQSDLLAISMLLCWLSILMYNGLILPFSKSFGLNDDLGLVSAMALMMVFQSTFFYFSFRHIVVFRRYRGLTLIFIFGFLLLSIFPWLAGSFFSFQWVLLSGVAFLGFSTYVSGFLAIKRLKPAKNLFFASATMLLCISTFALLASLSSPVSVVPLWIESLLFAGLLAMHLVQCCGLTLAYFNKQNKNMAFFEHSYREIRQHKNNLTLENLRQQKILSLQEQRTAENHQRFEATLRHIDHQKSIIEEKNKDIMDGIRYAHRIQNSLLSHREKMKEQLPSSFVIFQPKDIVSGDFYFCANLRNTKGETGNKVLLAAIDCAGHGVSGALLAVIGNLMLNNIVSEGRTHSPADILYELDTRLNQIIGNQQSEYPLNHGMDISLCVLDKHEKQLVYAGARRPLMIFQKGILHEIKGSKSSVGVNLTEAPKKFFDTDISYQTGDTFYLFTDGYVDQFAEKGGKKFMVSQFRELLTEIQTMQPEQQEKRLKSAINTWKGIDKQTDDILVMGVRV